MNVFNFIKQRIAILDVIGQYTSLKKAGVYWKACCPFHNERTPSFTVSPHKEIFYCFGCHTGGDVISFISKAENCSPMEAVRHLQDRYSITLPDDYQEAEQDKITQQKEKYAQVCALFAQWAHYYLRKSPAALSYITGRGITARSCTSFMLGYVPNGARVVQSLIDAMQKKYLMVQDLLDAHILIQGKHGLYCPFEERIIFPIKDHLGRICGFGGRVFHAADDRVKYYNSHDHQFFAKGSLLFGLDSAKKAIQETGAVFLVEGYTDVIALAQVGFAQTVATLGTACTLEHLKQLARYAQKVYLVYDADAAGQKAIMRLTDLCWNVNLDLYVITLPAGQDPASYIAQQGDFNLLVEQSTDIFTFFVAQLGADFVQKSLQERLTALGKIIALIGHIKEPLTQELILQKVTTVCGIAMPVLKQELARTQEQASNRSTLADQKEQVPTPPMQVHKISQLEKKLFSAILANTCPLTQDDQLLLSRWLTPPLNQLLTAWVGLPVGTVLLDTLDPVQKAFVSALLIEGGPEDEQGIELLVQFYKKQWKITVHDVKLRLEAAHKQGDREMVTQLLSDIDTLKKKMLQRGIA